MLPLHAHCLFKLGCYLGEMWYLTELADWLRANGRNRFLLTAPPLRLPGAVGFAGDPGRHRLSHGNRPPRATPSGPARRLVAPIS